LLRTPRSATSKGFILRLLSGVIVVGLLGGIPSNAQILHKKKKPADKSASTDSSAQPDKVLYDRAKEDIRRGRHEVGRLNLQTLINTYPDSEYLAKAKLLIADSYYKEGGTANMTQAISGYKDFIVFFPFLSEASYAQLQVAMGHYRQMEKPDRDRTEAKEAEAEFQIFLQKYPKDPLADKAMQHLREVQEVIAEGDFRVAYYYYMKGDKRAAAARLMGVTSRYPLYSNSDRALFMLGDIFEGAEKKELAANYYSRIVKNYPLSKFVSDAKTKLVAMKVPVPQPDPKSQAWMVAEQNVPRPRVSLMSKPMGVLKSGPTNEMRSAAQVGAPTLEAEPDTSSATDVLTGGNQSRIVVGGGSGTGSSTGSTTGIVATVTPGTRAENNGATEGAAEGAAPADGSAPPATDSSAPGAAQPDSGSVTPAGESSSAAPADTSGTGAAGGSDAAGAAAGTDAAKTDAATADAAKTDAKPDSDGKTKESTSKKKKGVRKLIPW
jgi:outer membrane protein assembly factor BamD